MSKKSPFGSISIAALPGEEESGRDGQQKNSDKVGVEHTKNGDSFLQSVLLVTGIKAFYIGRPTLSYAPF